MIILANLKHDQIETTDENGIIDYLTRISYKSFNDILNSCYKYIEKYKKDIPIPQINKNYKIQKSEIINNITTITQKIKVKELTKQNEIINEEHYSKNSLSLYTNDEIKNMELGTKMHYILEMLDFQEPDLSIYNDFEKQIIASLLKQPIMQNLNNAKIYKEYEFIYEDKQNIKHGIIDLMLEYDNYIDIIDYKLKNTTDKAYLNQLNGYKEFIKNKTNKNVFIYLYSLYNQELINLN
jgi:ATP-dependent exoDNAse (exonuclease V) beta subunit